MHGSAKWTSPPKYSILVIYSFADWENSWIVCEARRQLTWVVVPGSFISPCRDVLQTSVTVLRFVRSRKGRPLLQVTDTFYTVCRQLWKIWKFFTSNLKAIVRTISLLLLGGYGCRYCCCCCCLVDVDGWGIKPIGLIYRACAVTELGLVVEHFPVEPGIARSIPSHTNLKY